MKESVKRTTALPLVVAMSAFVFFPVQSPAIESASTPVLARGRLQADGAAGAVVTDGEYQFGWDTSLRVGIAPILEAAAPAALAVRLFGSDTEGIVYLGLGIIDLFVEQGTLLYEPSIMVGGFARFGPEASIRAAMDFSGAENGIERKEHPYWLRGSVGLVFDMGKVATLAFGLSYQRIVIDGEHPAQLARTGWAGDSRVSFGSVKTQPISDLPLFSVHLQEGLDFMLITRVDVNAAARTTDIRCLLGFSITVLSESAGN